MMKKNIEISWIDNDCLYPYTEFSSAVYDDRGSLSKDIKCKDNFSITNNNDNDSNNGLFSSAMHNVVAYIINCIPNAISNMNFQKYYNLIMPSDNERKILKSCYGILMSLRTWETHYIHSSTDSNNNYGYVNKSRNNKEERFFIHIPPKGITLLMEILTTVEKHCCGIATQGHYLDFLYFRYNMLYTYIKNYGQFISSRTKLFELKVRAKLKWQKRCLVLNPIIELNDEHIWIRNSIFPNDALDFLVVVDGQTYIIPQEILHNHGFRLSNVTKWKAIGNKSHGVSFEHLIPRNDEH